MRGKRITPGVVTGRDIRTIAGIGVLGAGIAGGLVLIGTWPQVLASDTAQAVAEVPMAVLDKTVRDFLPPAVDTDALLKWDFVADPGIAREPIRQSTVTKIAFGRVVTVDVVETASGIYSSDAMVDPHIRYPGITRTRKAAQRLAVWDGFGWAESGAMSAGSFLTITPFDGGNLVVSDDGMCVVRRSGSDC